MSLPTRARAAAVLPVVALAVLVLTVVGESALSRDDAMLLAPDPSWVFAINGLVFSLSAAAVLSRQVVGRLGLALAGLAVGWTLGALLQLAVRSGADAAPLLWLTELCSYPLIMLTVVLAAFFPDGRLLSGAWGKVVAVAVAAHVLTTALIAAARTPVSLALTDISTPPVPAAQVTGVPGLADVLEPHVQMIITIAYVPSLVIGAALIERYRRSVGAERDQVRWLAWCAVSVTFIGLGFQLLIDPGKLNTLGALLIIDAIAVGVAAASVNPTRISIEDLLSRTLVYGALSIAIILVDLTALAALTAVLGERLDDEQVVLMVLLVSAVVYNPLRSQLWALVRRLVLGERDDRYDVVAGLASSLEATDESREQLSAVAQAVGQAFGIAYVAVEVDRDGEPTVASWGTAPAEVRRLPITYRGDEVGQLVLPARGVRTRLSPRDQRLLGDLVRQAATAARTSRLAEQLQENRQRLVVAREEERRRIRHDLHEDLGPTLGGLVHQVETARLLVREQPEAAKETIARTSALLREVVADVRRVVHDLRPPALDDRGLVGAVRQQAELATTETLLVTVAGERIDGLPAAVEVAAFRIVSQALADVRADVRATRVEVALERGPRGLQVTLGTDADLDPESLRTRAAEIGGRVEAEVDRVVVRLPIREDAA